MRVKPSWSPSEWSREAAPEVWEEERERESNQEESLRAAIVKDISYASSSCPPPSCSYGS